MKGRVNLTLEGDRIVRRKGSNQTTPTVRNEQDGVQIGCTFIDDKAWDVLKKKREDFLSGKATE